MLIHLQHLVFASAAAMAGAAIVITAGPQWRRILRVAAGGEL